MLNNLTLNSILLLLIGFLAIIFGGYVAVSWRAYPFTAGLVFLGLSSLFCGITNGFTDYSARGRFFWKIGVTAFLLGLLLTGFGLYRLT